MRGSEPEYDRLGKVLGVVLLAIIVATAVGYAVLLSSFGDAVNGRD